MRFLDRSVKYVGILLMLLPLTLVLLPNLDESPDPGTVEFGKVSGDDVPEQANAYFALFGFWIADGDDIRHAGQAMVRDFETELARNPRMDSFEFDANYKFITLHGDQALLCQPKKQRCLSKLERDGPAARNILAMNPEIQKRYRSLYAYQSYRNVSTPRFFTPLPRSIQTARHLRLTDIGLEWIEGKTTAALAALDNDTEFWRRMLAESNDLLMKATSVRAISDNLLLLSEMVVSRPIAQNDLTLVQKMLMPLDTDEIDFTRPMQYEFIMAQHTYHTVFEPKPKWGKATKYIMARIANAIYAPNECINITYRRYKEISELAKITARDFDARAKTLDKPIFTGALHEYRYNPLGRWMIQMSELGWSKYPAKIHDFEGLRRMIALVLEIKQHELRADQIENFLASSDERYFDPYTGKPVQWDSGNRTIYFRGRGNTSDSHQFIEARVF